MLLRVRVTSFLAGFGLASAGAFYFLRNDITASSSYLAAQVRSAARSGAQPRSQRTLNRGSCAPMRSWEGEGAPALQGASAAAPREQGGACKAGAAAAAAARPQVARRRSRRRPPPLPHPCLPPPPLHPRRAPLPQAQEARDSLEARVSALEAAAGLKKRPAAAAGQSAAAAGKALLQAADEVSAAAAAAAEGAVADG